MVGKQQQTLRQKRGRIAFVTVLAFFSGVVLYLRTDILILGIPLPLVTGLLYAAIIGPATIAIFAFLPALSRMIENLALSRLSVSVFVFIFPGPGDVLLASPHLMAAFVVAGGFLFGLTLRKHP